jgi:hypothetical protein
VYFFILIYIYFEKWANYQILDSITFTLEVKFPSPLLQFLDSLHIISFDLFIIDCLPGGYITSVFLWTMIPIGISLFNLFLCQVRIWRLMRSSEFKELRRLGNQKINDGGESEMKLDTMKKKITNEHFGFFLLLIFTLLPPVVRRQFIALNCFNYNDHSLLRIDTSVDCKSPEYKLFRMFDIFVIILFMTLPLYWAFLLQLQKNILNPPATDEYVLILHLVSFFLFFCVSLFDSLYLFLSIVLFAKQSSFSSPFLLLCLFLFSFLFRCLFGMFKICVCE